MYRNNLTIDGVRTIEHDNAYGINVLRHKYSDDPKFKLHNFFVHNQDTVFPLAPKRDTENQLKNVMFKNKLSIKQRRETKNSQINQSHQIL